jgi:hypothetical protein
MKDIQKLLDRVFNEFAHENIIKDFHFMAKYSKLKIDGEEMKLCLLWFALGHVNTLDRESNFIKNYNGEDTNGGKIQ